MHCIEWEFLNLDENLTEVFAKGPIYNIPSLIQIMAWLRPGDKPLPEPMLIQITDTYMRH